VDEYIKGRAFIAEEPFSDRKPASLPRHLVRLASVANTSELVWSGTGNVDTMAPGVAVDLVAAAVVNNGLVVQSPAEEATASSI